MRGRWDGMVQVGRGCNLSLPEIDEVLFRLPWLLDYSVVLTKREGVNWLEAVVYGNPGQGQRAHEVLFALKGIPSVRMGIELGSLRLAPVSVAEQSRFSVRQGKRRITDHRQG